MFTIYTFKPAFVPAKRNIVVNSVTGSIVYLRWGRLFEELRVLLGFRLPGATDGPVWTSTPWVSQAKNHFSLLSAS